SVVVDACECSFFFFFQAEDGIRDWSVTGVQTCALPISQGLAQAPRAGERAAGAVGRRGGRRKEGQRRLQRDSRPAGQEHPVGARSEERRGGEEGGYRWGGETLKKKKREGERR